MDTKPLQRKRRDDVRSSLNAAIHDMGRAWFITEKTLIIEVFSSAHQVLGMIRVRSLLLLCGLSNSCVTRIPWRAKPTTLNLGSPSPMCVEPLTRA